MSTTERILIYRPASLGDTIVALPSFHLVRRALPCAYVGLLTDGDWPGALAVERTAEEHAWNDRRSSAEMILKNSGLIDDAIAYQPRLSGLSSLHKLRRRILDWRPDRLIYLAPHLQSMRAKAFRDIAFFAACGVRRFHGIPYTSALCRHNYDENRKLYESEAERLTRCLESLGAIDVSAASSWSLNFTQAERIEAESVLNGWSARRLYFCFSIGTKWAVNDWGDDNWSAVISRITSLVPGAGLLALGSKTERDRSERLIAHWEGPRFNLCGLTSPRISGILLEQARAFFGHDSGPMHLAASVGTSCIVVFSRKNPPGVWFPTGTGHFPLYPPVPSSAAAVVDGGISAVSASRFVESFRDSFRLGVTV